MLVDLLYWTVTGFALGVWLQRRRWPAPPHWDWPTRAGYYAFGGLSGIASAMTVFLGGAHLAGML